MPGQLQRMTSRRFSPTPMPTASGHAWDKRTAEGRIFLSARGSTVTDIQGKDYLDFNSGQMCINVLIVSGPVNRPRLPSACMRELVAFVILH
jgi:4-aminobutyrate aminotransferase-like enzyme